MLVISPLARQNRLFYILVLSLALAACKKQPVKPVTPYYPDPVVKDSTFTNPILANGPDPWIVKKDSFYYYTHTLGDRISLWKTKSVAELGTAEIKIVWAPAATGSHSQNIWAPELHLINNKWYLYFTAGSSGDLATQRLFVLENTSDDPLQGTWTDLGQVADPTANYFSIDATVLQHNAKNYLIWSGHPSATDNTQYLYIAQLNTPSLLQTSRVEISRPTYNWETQGAPPGVNEGPEVLKSPAGKVFLVYSASGCWTDEYALGMLTLKDNGDPMIAADWTKTPTPVFVKSPANNAFGPGHNSFFKSQNGSEDWILYHANLLSNQGCGDLRNPRIQKFSWNASGTPNFGIPVKTNVEMLKPAGEY